MTASEVQSIEYSERYYYLLKSGKIKESTKDYKFHQELSGDIFYTYIKQHRYHGKYYAKRIYNKDVIAIFTLEQIKEIYPEILI